MILIHLDEATRDEPGLKRRREVAEILTELLGCARAGTSRQLPAELAERGVALSARQGRRYLGMLKARWRRTPNSLRHKQVPRRSPASRGCRTT